MRITIESIQNRIVDILQERLEVVLKKQIDIVATQAKILEKQLATPAESCIDSDSQLKSLDDQLAVLEEEELKILLDQYAVLKEHSGSSDD